MTELFKENLGKLEFDIQKYSENPSQVVVVAVSKFQPASSIKRAHSLGQIDFGENYAKELEEKVSSDELQHLSDIKWHFIGNLQTNKIRKLSKLAYMIQTVSRVKELEFLAEAGCRAKILIELKFTDSPTKSGTDVTSLNTLIKRAEQLNLNLVGLMTMGEQNDKTKTEAIFNQAYKAYLESGLKVLSMGMSDDYDIALSCGSNMIRIGTFLFGKRDIKS